MQELRKRSHHFQEIHYPGHSWFVTDVFQFKGDETRSNIHIDFWIYGGNRIFVHTNLFDSTFKKQDRRNAMTRLHSNYATTKNSHKKTHAAGRGRAAPLSSTLGAKPGYL